MPLCNGARARYDNLEDIDDLLLRVASWSRMVHPEPYMMHPLEIQGWSSQLLSF